MMRLLIPLFFLYFSIPAVAHPDFNQGSDVCKLIFAATQDFAHQRKMKMRLSDGRSYRFTFLCNTLFDIKGVPGALAAPFLFHEIYSCEHPSPHKNGCHIAQALKSTCKNPKCHQRLCKKASCVHTCKICRRCHYHTCGLPNTTGLSSQCPNRKSYHAFRHLFHFYRNAITVRKFDHSAFHKIIALFYPDLKIDWDDASSTSSSSSSSSSTPTNDVSWHDSDSILDIDGTPAPGHGNGCGQTDESSESSAPCDAPPLSSHLIDEFLSYDDYLMHVLDLMSHSDAGQAFIRYIELINLFKGNGDGLIQKCGLPTVKLPSTNIQYYTLKLAIAPPVVFSLTDLGR